MSEPIVWVTPEGVARAREERNRVQASALVQSWLRLVSGAMQAGDYEVDTMTPTGSTDAVVIRTAVERLADALKSHGWARVWWTPCEVRADHALMAISSTFGGSTVVRLHWAEHPEPKAANDPGMAGLGAQGWARG